MIIIYKTLVILQKIFVRNEKGLFTLLSPSMFSPFSIDELVKNIKEMINTYKTTLEITISKKIKNKEYRLLF